MALKIINQKQELLAQVYCGVQTTKDLDNGNGPGLFECGRSKIKECVAILISVVRLKLKKMEQHRSSPIYR